MGEDIQSLPLYGTALFSIYMVLKCSGGQAGIRVGIRGEGGVEDSGRPWLGEGVPGHGVACRPRGQSQAK